MKLQRKISLVTGLLITGLILFLGLLMMQQWMKTLQMQLELESRDLAVVIASDEAIQKSLTLTNGSIPIQRIALSLKLKTRAQYIHILNTEGHYYSHTYPSQLGHVVEDPFLKELLREPQTAVRRSGDTRQPGVEAIAPVFYHGEFTGLVIVGFLNGRIYQEYRVNIFSLISVFVLTLFGGLYAAGFLSKSIKKSIHDLEPEEIARLMEQRSLILENLKEAIVTIDQAGRLIFINRSAGKLLSLDATDLNRSITLYPFREGFLSCLSSGEPKELEVRVPGGVFVGRFKPVKNPSGEIAGVTAVMEDLTDVRLRAEELTGVVQVNEALRAQNHEFINKLHTISGLIQLEEYDEAIHYIMDVSSSRQEVIAQLNRCIKDPSVAGLLLGKYNKAQEQHTLFSLDPESYLPAVPHLKDDLSVILGNLMENSLEEIAGQEDGLIELSIQSRENRIHLSLGDNGGGINREDLSRIFEKGFSRKGPDRGFGLFLLREKVTALGGSIEITSHPGETLFSIELPLEEK